MTNQLSESDLPSHGGPQTALAAAGVGNVDAYEATWVTTFSDLFRPIELAASDGQRRWAHRQPRGRVRAWSEGTFLLAAALLGARRMAQAARLLQRLDVMTADRSDRLQWRARAEFLWAVYAEHISDIPGVLEHSAAAAQIIKHAAGSTPGPHAGPGPRRQPADHRRGHLGAVPLMAAGPHRRWGDHRSRSHAGNAMALSRMRSPVSQPLGPAGRPAGPPERSLTLADRCVSSRTPRHRGRPGRPGSATGPRPGLLRTEPARRQLEATGTGLPCAG